jgi:ABC-type dipeptide/oligopeptide/nickel transport system permease subunit
MSKSTRTLLTISSVFLSLICYALFVYYPAFPKSVLGWLSLIFIGMPSLLFFEWLGEKTLGSEFFNRLSVGMRIALGVPVFIILMGFVLLLASYATHLINL